MATEGVLSRMGRVITGMAHSAINAAEQANPEGVLEQAIREIEGAADEVRTELGRAIAERHRLEARSKELERERDELEQKAQTAVAAGRDDLAKAGISRQIDIEAQSNLLGRLVTEASEKINQLNATLDAVRASHREAKDRLRQLSASKRDTAHAGAPAGRPTDRVAAAVERAEQVTERVTGVPLGPPIADQKALDELHAIHREREVEERLARLKMGRS